VGHDREQQPPADATSARTVLTGAEAVQRVERAIVGNALARDPAVAEGLALAGVRAASVSPEFAASPASESCAVEASCVHHVTAEPGRASPHAAFELAATSAQAAVDHCLAAHLLSHKLGQPGVCSLAPSLARDLALLQLPDESVIAARLAGAGESEPAAGPDRVVELAREALAAARTASAPLEPLLGGGPDTAEVVLVASGADAEAARAAARAASEAGIPTRWLALALIRPLPVAELRARLAGARHVFAVGAAAAAAGWLAAALRATIAEKAGLHCLTDAHAEALVAALREALPVCGFDASRLRSPERGPLEHRLVFAPASDWGEQTARRALALLARRSALRIGARVRHHGGAGVIGWSGAAPGGGARDLLLASHPAVLDPAGALALLRPGAAVLLLSDAATPAELMRQLSPAAHLALRERGLRVHWLGSGSGDGRKPTPGSAERAASLALAAGAVAILAGPETANGDGEPGGADGSALRALEPADLATPPPSEEIDFRAAPKRLRLPAAEESPEERAAWARWLGRFHRSGAAEDEAPGLRPLLPATLAVLAEEFRSSAPHAFVVVPAAPGSKLTACSLRDLLGEALAAVQTPGREARTLADNLGSLASFAAQRLASGETGAPVKALLAGLGIELAQRLAISDDAARGLQSDVDALRAALPDGARAFDLRPDTPLRLYLTVLQAARAPLERSFAAQLEKLRDGLRDRLQLDRMGSAEGQTPEALASEIGETATRLLDPDALARALPKSPGWAQLGERRRRRIEAALATLERHLERDQPFPPAIFLRPPGVDLPLPDLIQSEHPDPLAAAVGYFDGTARGMAELFAAARLARLLLAGTYRPEIHDAMLAQLDWEAFSAEELALLPAVTVVTTGRRLRQRGQGSLSELLRSSRPVRVLVQDDLTAADEAEDLSRFHIDLGQLVMAHRETFALSTTLARPGQLVERLARVLAQPRPGVLLVQVAAGAPATWRPLLAEAALRGRACPDFLYDPEAGPSWADRFDVDGNPDPELAWPIQRVPYLAGESERALEAEFTFADAVALEPAYLRHLRVIPPIAWQDEVQIPLASYVARFEPGKAAREIPFLWVVDASGTLQRAVVTQELAMACRDRLRAWRVLQEFGGFENAYAERAAAAAREAAEAAAERERAELLEAHSEALANAQRDGARESMQRLAAALLNRNPLAALVPAQSGAAAPTVAAPAKASARSAEPEPAAAEEAEPALSFDEPYIEMVLCTSCNDCTNINSRMFQYNADKQAFIADATAGTFAELVKAAVKCPAKCIHPGKPRPDDATATPELVARAAEIN
jgi:hypothetical protein